MIQSLRQTNGPDTMLKNSIRTSLLLRLGRRVCVCLRNDHMDDRTRTRIRPFVIGRFACWCDKSPAR
jgi:hypothetical protein